MKSKWLLALVLSFPVLALGADLHVPEEVIGAETAMILNININKIKPDQLMKTMRDITGTPADDQVKAQVQQLTDAFKQLGGLSINVVFSVGKDAAKTNPADGAILVVEMKDGSAPDKFTEFVNQFPGVKDAVAAECPKAIGGKLVWYSKTAKLPAANAERAQAFTSAQYEVSDETSLSLIFVPGETTNDLAKTNLQGESAELAKAVAGGSGISLSSNFGVADAPTLKLLFMAADAGAAETIHKALTGMIASIKKDAPPEAKNLIDALKADQVGSNVQFSIGIVDWAKVLVAAFMGGNPGPKP